MKRLTKRGAISQRDIDNLMDYSDKNQFGRNDAYYKLQHYENLEEHGLLLELKLKVGDKFWELNDNPLAPTVYPRTAHSLQHVVYCMDRLGRLTFLTQKDAEDKLKKVQSK